jgi:hypothetical protein
MSSAHKRKKTAPVTAPLDTDKPETALGKRKIGETDTATAGMVIFYFHS